MLRCAHCASGSGEPRARELGLADWEGVVEDLSALGCRAVDLMGGEVLLSPLLPGVAGLLQRAGIGWGLLTNGWLLDEERAAGLFDLGCRGVGVSLDGATAATHDELRGRPGAFERALLALGVVAGLDLAPKNRAVLTSVSTRNVHELEAMGELLTRRAPGFRWQLNLCSASAPRLAPELRLDAAGRERVRKFIRRARRERPYELMVGAAHDTGYQVDEAGLRDQRWEGCPAGIHHVGVQSDGAVKGCLALDPSFSVGRVPEQRLRALWEDRARMARYREVGPEELGPGCRECVWASECRGGCTAYSVAHTGRAHDHPDCLWRNASPVARAVTVRPVVAAKDPEATEWTAPLQSACVELTLRCNLACAHCGQAAGRPRPSELEVPELARLFGDLAELGCRRVVLLGGEPLLHPHWEEIARSAAGAQLDFALVTNGLPVTGRVAKRLAALAPTHVGVSLDGASDAVHDALRGAAGAREKAWKAIERLRGAGLPVTVITTVTRPNVGELGALRDQLLAAGPGLVWQLQAANGTGERFRRELMVRPGQLLEVARFIEATRKATSREVLAVAGGHNIGHHACSVSDYGTVGRWRGCPGGVTSVGITSDGSVKGCLSMRASEEQGNIRERSLVELWRDPVSFARNRFSSPGLLTGGCARCPHGSLCRGGCPEMARSATGDTFDNPLCLRQLEGREAPSR